MVVAQVVEVVLVVLLLVVALRVQVLHKIAQHRVIMVMLQVLQI